MNIFPDLIREQHRERVPAEPAAEVARILDYARVPNVLWGWLAVGLVGIDQRFPQVEFVVADDKLQSAVEALVASGFTQCTDPACSELREDCLTPEFVRKDPKTPEEYGLMAQFDRLHPIADAHFHFDPSRYEHHTVLYLFRQSNTLWSGWWSDLTLTYAPTDGNCPEHERFPADHPHFLLSNDPNLYENEYGSGPWEGLYTVKFLKPTLFAEAIFFLWCRDFAHVKDVALYWSGIVIHGLIGIERINPQRDLIEAGLRPEILYVWQGFRTRWGHRNLKEFRQKLLDENRMPLPLPPHDMTPYEY